MSRLYRHEGLRLIRFAAAMLALTALAAKGQEIEPRAYTNAPVGLNFLIAGYNYTTGGVATDPALPIENTQVEIHTTLFAYARSLDFFGKSAKFDVVQPYAWASGSATVKDQSGEREVSGPADTRFRFAVNLYGAPALSMKDFANYRQDTIVGASVEVTAPSGQYDEDHLLNIGTNRWSIKPEIGVSKSLGRLTLELAGGIRFYTENDDFFGGRAREQDPLYSLQGHLTYSFGYGIWAAVDGTFYTGGRTTLDGVENNDKLENSRIGATLALPVNRYNSVKIFFHTGVSVRTGSDFSAMGINWQYRFGGEH
ncbi:transporter [Nitrosomonas sp. Nm58]|uniref:transporter n=1 Tax=Nitrosomonas sp. Nm58 TaxID=200126 RepID=UPI00089B68DE|nr:transporter [Nitrosomonas sp. Nm58]SDY03187.1 Putative MetA-pathway of phenol degradation [Nitrosomonas sp. Nm58]